jgi:hypothetical protein
MTTPVVDTIHVLRTALLVALRGEFERGALYEAIMQSLVLLDEELPDGLGREAITNTVKEFRDQCIAVAREGNTEAGRDRLWDEWSFRLGVDREVFEEAFNTFVQYSRLWG